MKGLNVGVSSVPVQLLPVAPCFPVATLTGARCREECPMFGEVRSARKVPAQRDAL